MYLRMYRFAWGGGDAWGVLMGEGRKKKAVFWGVGVGKGLFLLVAGVW